MQELAQEANVFFGSAMTSTLFQSRNELLATIAVNSVTVSTPAPLRTQTCTTLIKR